MLGDVTRDGIKVEVGQRWRDMDKRTNGRTVTITRVDADNGLAYYGNHGKRPAISIRRMYRHSTGFELLQPDPARGNTPAPAAFCTRCDGLQRTTPSAVPCTRCGGTGYEPH